MFLCALPSISLSIPCCWCPDVSFQCGDLLTSDLSRVAVLVLTEQCWDQELIGMVGCVRLNNRAVVLG